MEIAVENQMEDMWVLCVVPYGSQECVLYEFTDMFVYYRMAQPGIIGSLCADDQGLCVSGMYYCFVQCWWLIYGNSQWVILCQCIILVVALIYVPKLVRVCDLKKKLDNCCLSDIFEVHGGYSHSQLRHIQKKFTRIAILKVWSIQYKQVIIIMQKNPFG